MENHERMERELLEQCGQVATLVECFAWMQRCDECIEQLEELCRSMINYNHIEPHRFLEDAGNVVLEVRCPYDSSLSSYHFRRDKNCIAWFARQLNDLAHRVKDIISANMPMEALSVKLRFIVSYKFLASSLEKLASYLDKDKLKIIRSKFLTLSNEEFELLTRKVYEYIDCVEKLQDTRLPSRELFFSSLTGDTVSESDYSHAMNVWQRFSIQTLGEYTDLYLKTDVLLLADIFENFRLSQCSGRYAQANNKYMRSYDSSKPSSYLMYYDVNNLYGWAMCQSLPYTEFRWVEDTANFNVSAIAQDSPTGYILEVDLEYPQHLHDRHTDLHFCPTRDKLPGKREDKLLATLYDKQRYVIHYRNLQQCTRHGLRLTKIHRVLQFAQSPWLGDYIELNTQFRTRAKNDFEKNLYKLMNNAVFGKNMENVRDHVDVKLLTKWDRRYGAEAMIAKLNFHSRGVFAENLIAVELRKLEVKFNKPIYVGLGLAIFETYHTIPNVNESNNKFYFAKEDVEITIPKGSYEV
ncbi:hypothetical protein ALC57_10126 [Trachymyrmex cornetzi]|uniref:DNA-directed DNA polymerase n=1 Tax=Trachymyrmex cornetzi TaxID=471704 RepID=A0A151J4X5_9HYME|nr:hypothetical protein ALC57_10126 [Trachymyrmex cornetzi]